MPKLSGVFDQLKKIEKIPIENINAWLKVKVEPLALDNFIANRLSYPQTIPTSIAELEIDLAILKEAIRYDNSTFYDPKFKKIYIPEEFVIRFPPLTNLAAVFLDVLDLTENSKFYLKSKQKMQIIGTAIPVMGTFLPKITVKINDQIYQLKVGVVSVIPVFGSQIRVQIEDQSPFFASGGQLGLVFDTRKKR